MSTATGFGHRLRGRSRRWCRRRFRHGRHNCLADDRLGGRGRRLTALLLWKNNHDRFGDGLLGYHYPLDGRRWFRLSRRSGCRTSHGANQREACADSRTCGNKPARLCRGFRFRSARNAPAVSVLFWADLFRSGGLSHVRLLRAALRLPAALRLCAGLRLLGCLRPLPHTRRRMPDRLGRWPLSDPGR